MRRTTTERLLIIKRTEDRDYRGKIVALSPERGRLVFTAKGLFKPQSKLSGHLEPLSLVDGLIVWSKEPLLSAAVSRQSFLGLKSDLALIVVSTELVRRVIEWWPLAQPLPRSWQDLITILTQWNSHHYSLSQLTVGSQIMSWRLARELGYAPGHTCIQCGRPLSTAFWSETQGGFFCEVCQPKGPTYKLSPSTLVIWEDLVQDEHLQLTKLPSSPTILEELTAFFNSWLNFLALC
ncbi:hypothetical protein KBI31_01235 [Patescibacteria group bacterium]|jgi:DNA repair protein RecO (recombination protein O)|nr:hypothetical protein [Patescibacteria group bacterium]HPD07604.1 DNA repair protein RecO C-terminal domain-containing protein [bacterium]HRT10919.1 DNA repair protein RecO C-terminal domain-containing protein [Patescibacteria group bacterium]HRU90103.1 DNA repair protein RecO C-terminal domain-containing protein [Patescibacteria group bacterium]